AVSLDAKTVLFARADNRTDIWAFDAASNETKRLTFENGGTSNPLWTRDGRLLFFARRQNAVLLVERPASGIGHEFVRKQYQETENLVRAAVSRDGRWMSMSAGGGGDGRTLLVAPADGTEVPFPEDRAFGLISPDGRWVVYQTDVDRRTNVF